MSVDVCEKSRELKTIVKMLKMYCDSLHDTKKHICTDCQELLDYSGKRLSNCLFKNIKPTCSKCPVHCYNPLCGIK